MCANSFFDQSFMYVTPTLWNALDLDIILLSFDAFNKKRVTSPFKVLCKLILIIFMLFLFLPCVFQYKSTELVSLHWILDFN